jgi:hypothetical protein
MFVIFRPLFSKIFVIINTLRDRSKQHKLQLYDARYIDESFPLVIAPTILLYDPMTLQTIFNKNNH